MGETITQVTGYIKPLGYQTRIRQYPNTFGTVLVSDCNPNDILTIDEIIEYDSDNPSLAIRKNDRWGHVIKRNDKVVDGWTAILYHQYTNPRICSEHYTINNNEEPNPEPIEVIGATVVLKYSDQTLSEPIEMEVK